MNSNDEVFSTEPVKNVGKATTLSFYHAQNVGYEPHFTIKLFSVHLSLSVFTENRRKHRIRAWLVIELPDVYAQLC